MPDQNRETSSLPVMLGLGPHKCFRICNIKVESLKKNGQCRSGTCQDR